MSDEGSQDKQLPASQRKLDKARKDGQVVRSKDLGHFLVMLAATGVLMGLAARAGAVAAGADPARSAAVAQFGEELGVGLQMLDDLLFTGAQPSPARRDGQ